MRREDASLSMLSLRSSSGTWLNEMRAKTGCHDEREGRKKGGKAEGEGDELRTVSSINNARKLSWKFDQRIAGPTEAE